VRDAKMGGIQAIDEGRGGETEKGEIDQLW